jgi:hypothetical protein
MTKTIQTEKLASTLPGLLMLPLFLVGAAAFGRAGILSLQAEPGVVGFGFLFLGFFCLFCLSGLFVVNPNEARVVQLFGDYVGTVKEDGLRWANPFYTKRSVMLRVRNFESAKLKVNDHDGNPIEIGAVVVWKVVDTAEACFEVDNYEHYVNVQSESAIRTLASDYPYDAHDRSTLRSLQRTRTMSPSTSQDARSRSASTRRASRDRGAASRTSPTRPRSPPRCSSRQQAGAIIAARQRIVEGAVGMVEHGARCSRRRRSSRSTRSARPRW